ncbi:hypothetical protein Poli38472_012197 [Pythium oligandrum]|uniref:Calponin-homology (CH) domain-containing protein n=1 Tax=Pythium oligandrum TaxID=41045 RepID=A0A8K1FLF4_PYTOL|nr:hypothetical protein Poli38472_012197 [Pythium oligandrum]|eukprot:TMW67081.1 hypothetical protein Poli38472_012197 [Pythium oligandrum]
MEGDAERSLLLWIQSFEDKVADSDGAAITSLVDLVDGVFLSRVMNHIDAEYLNLELINTQASGNWALQASNLKTLLRAVELYYHDELGQICEAQELIDVARIAKEHDTKEIARLVELLLGCAVQCPSKSEYIHPIMQMDASEQASMMHMIENLMHRFQLASPQHQQRNSLNQNSFGYLSHEGESSESLQYQLAQALEKASQMELRFLDMENEKRELTERFENVLAEKESLAQKYTVLEDERDKLVSERQSTLTRDNKKIQQIVEGEIHALTVQLEERNEELARVKRESSERLMVLENEVRRQADELDISRSKISQLGKLEASVAKYKKKLEEMNSLRTQVKDLENHNAQYLDKVLDLESTVKTIPALKTLVERYKNQVVELETANVEVASSNQIKDQKIKRLQEELDSAFGGKEFLESQVEELRSQIASMQHHHQQQVEDEEGGYTSAAIGSTRTHGTGDHSEGGVDSAGEALSSLSVSRPGPMGYSADYLLGQESVTLLRERITRLERENAELKRNGGVENLDQSQLSNELDMALKAKEALHMAMFELKQQNDQLHDELESLRQRATMDTTAAAVAGGVAGSPAAAPAQTQVQAQAPPASPPKPSNIVEKEKIAEYEQRIGRLQEQIEAGDSLRATVTELTNRLKEKESMINELSEQRSKLENYTKKTLHAVQTKYMVAVSSHRNQINEKQERIDFLEKKMKETRVSYSREQALMMSAFYEIGTEMQRRTMMPQTPGQGAQPAAWLASKRTEERAKRRQF